MPSLKAVSLSWTLSWAAVLLGEHEGQKTFPVSFGFHYFVPTQGRGAGKRPREAETGSLQRGGRAALPWTRLAEGEEATSVRCGLLGPAPAVAIAGAGSLPTPSFPFGAIPSSKTEPLRRGCRRPGPEARWAQRRSGGCYFEASSLGRHRGVASGRGRAAFPAGFLAWLAP